MSNDDMDLINLWFQDVEGKTRITAICQPITDTEARRRAFLAWADTQAEWPNDFQVWCAALDTVAVPEGLSDRIDAAITSFTSGRASMHVPPLPDDVDIVLAECLTLIKAIHAAGVRTK